MMQASSSGIVTQSSDSASFTVTSQSHLRGCKRITLCSSFLREKGRKGVTRSSSVTRICGIGPIGGAQLSLSQSCWHALWFALSRPCVQLPSLAFFCKTGPCTGSSHVTACASPVHAVRRLVRSPFLAHCHPLLLSVRVAGVSPGHGLSARAGATSIG